MEVVRSNIVKVVGWLALIMTYSCDQVSDAISSQTYKEAYEKERKMNEEMKQKALNELSREVSYLNQLIKSLSVWDEIEYKINWSLWYDVMVRIGSEEIWKNVKLNITREKNSLNINWNNIKRWELVHWEFSIYETNDWEVGISLYSYAWF